MSVPPRMAKVVVTTCGTCPYYVASGHGEPSQCGWRGIAYEEPERMVNSATVPPKWCPLPEYDGTADDSAQNRYTLERNR